MSIRLSNKNRTPGILIYRILNEAISFYHCTYSDIYFVSWLTSRINLMTVNFYLWGGFTFSLIQGQVTFARWVNFSVRPYTLTSLSISVKRPYTLKPEFDQSKDYLFTFQGPFTLAYRFSGSSLNFLTDYNDRFFQSEDRPLL